MRRLIGLFAKGYLTLAAFMFVCGVAFGVWMVANGQQPLDLLTL